MKAAVVSEKGSRPTMEDAHYLDLNFGNEDWIFGGIYDGHNGDSTAKYAAENLQRIFLRKLLGGLTPQQAFSDSYETVSREIGRQESGTTTVDFLIRNTLVYTANVGDARAIIVSRHRVSQLTIDHRLDDAGERTRVSKMGAIIDYPYIFRGNQGLMPTRTIGDEYFKAVGVIAAPSLGEHLIAPDDLMLISACDGLWDFMNNAEAAELAREYPEPESLLEVLTREVLVNRAGTDNLTMIAVSLSE
jgi:protein phosphatase PTC2/3